MTTTTAATTAKTTTELYPATIQSILAGATECTVTVGLECGYKVSEAGKASPVYATVRVACKEQTIEAALAALEAMGTVPIKVSIPKVVRGTLTLQLSPIMPAARFAALCK